jgi:ABC-type nitrate/sulfonate/bicarbonate transport system substrate-binding protein
VVPAVAAALTAAIAGCSSSGSSTPSSSSSATTTTTAITVGLPPANVGLTPFYYALAQGLFARDHLDVRIQTLSAASVGPAVTGGNVNIILGAANTLADIAGVQKAKVIFDAYANQLYLVARPGVVSQPCGGNGGLQCTAVQTEANLKQIAGSHQTVGLTAPGSSSASAAAAAFAAVGSSLGAGAKAVYLQTPSALEAGLVAGTINLSIANVAIEVLMKDKGMQVVADVTQWSDEAPWFANTDWAQSNKAAVVRFLADYCAGAKAAYSDQANAEAAIAKYMDITDKAQIDESWQIARTAWACQPFADSEIQAMLKSLTPAPNVSPGSLVDDQYIDAVGSANWVKPQR